MISSVNMHVGHSPPFEEGLVYWRDGEGDDVPCLQKPDEMEWLLELYRKLAPQRVLELGSFYGGTTRQFLKNGAPGSSIVSVCDKHINEKKYPDWEEMVSWEYVKDMAPVLIPIRGSTQDPNVQIAVKRYAPFDFVFIDADHTYEGVYSDWRMYGSLMSGCTKNGSVVVFHDIVEVPYDHMRVSDLWAKIKASGLKAEEFIGTEVEQRRPWGGLGVVYL